MIKMVKLSVIYRLLSAHLFCIPGSDLLNYIYIYIQHVTIYIQCKHLVPVQEVKSGWCGSVCGFHAGDCVCFNCLTLSTFTIVYFLFHNISMMLTIL